MTEVTMETWGAWTLGAWASSDKHEKGQNVSVNCMQKAVSKFFVLFLSLAVEVSVSESIIKPL